MNIYDANTVEDIRLLRLEYLEKDHELIYGLLKDMSDIMESQSRVILSQSETIGNLMGRDMSSVSARVVEVGHFDAIMDILQKLEAIEAWIFHARLQSEINGLCGRETGI